MGKEKLINPIISLKEEIRIMVNKELGLNEGQTKSPDFYINEIK